MTIRLPTPRPNPERYLYFSLLLFILKLSKKKKYWEWPIMKNECLAFTFRMVDWSEANLCGPEIWLKQIKTQMRSLSCADYVCRICCVVFVVWEEEVYNFWWFFAAEFLPCFVTILVRCSSLQFVVGLPLQGDLQQQKQ